MYEASAARTLNLSTMEGNASGIHLSDSVIRFAMCQEQLAVERRFKDVAFEGVSFLQVQFEQNHFLQTHFTECNFTDVIFHGCVFVNCTFSGAVFVNCHFQNCTLIDTQISEGPMEARMKFQNCLFLPGVSRIPASAESSQNWLAGADLPDRAPKGFEVLKAPAPKPAAHPPLAAVTPEAILARQREAEYVLPDRPVVASESPLSTPGSVRTESRPVAAATKPASKASANTQTKVSVTGNDSSFRFSEIEKS